MTRPAVMFLCVHNAGRSQMAAGWLEALAGDRVDVYSAGSEPASAVNELAVVAMRETGIDIATARPRRWTESQLAEMSLVITMGCGDSCPVLPGVEYRDWELPDPSVLDLEGVRSVRDEIASRVRDLIEELDVQELDESS